MLTSDMSGYWSVKKENESKVTNGVELKMRM